MKLRREQGQSETVQKWVEAGYTYEHTPVYLGLEQVLLSPDGNVRIYWSCTARDGMILQVKRLRPYHIGFDYVDGGAVVNEDREELRRLFQRLRGELDTLRRSGMVMPWEQVREELDKIVLAHADAICRMETATE